MPVTGATTRNDYTATSGQTVFAYTFGILNQTDIKVFQNDSLLTLTTDYTVSGVGSGSGGNVTLTSGASANDTVSIVLAMSITRTTNYQNSGDFLAADVNNDFDKAYIALNQVQTDANRSIGLSDVEPTVNMQLPDREQRANKFLRFNTLGQPEVTSGTPVDDVNVTRSGNHAFRALNYSDAGYQRFNLTRQGTDATKVAQGFASDPYTGELYVIQPTNADPETHVINKYDSNGNVVQTSSRYNSTPVSTIGKQQLDVSWDKDGNRWFWTAENESVSEYAKYVKRFQISDGSGTELVISNPGQYQLFSDDEITGLDVGSATPCVSLDGRYLIAEYSGSSTKRIKVFSLPDLLDGGPGDYSNSAIYNWTFTFTNNNTAIQGMASDGDYLYIFIGKNNNGDSNLKVLVYTITGELIQDFDDFTIGESVAIADSTPYLYEFEGAGWLWRDGVPFLAVGIASGAVGSRKFRLWTLGGGMIKDEPEGTWTVTVEDSSSSGNVSPTTATGQYVKMGNMVWINFNITDIDITGMTGSNNAYIKGAPFTPPQSAVLGSIVENDYDLPADAFNVVAEIGTDGQITLREVRDDAVNVITNVSQIDGADIRVSGWFKI